MERRVIVSASLAHATTHGLELTFAALLLRIGLEFGADLAVMGLIVNVGTFTFGATALPSGYLTDRYGPRAVMAVGTAAAAGFALLVALSPTLPVLAVTLSLLGAALGLYHPAGTSMVATVQRRRGLAFAVHGIAGNLGVALAPAIGTVIAIVFGWREAYLVYAAFAAVVSLTVWRIAPTRAESEAVTVAGETAPVAVAESGLPRTAPPAERRWTTRPLIFVFIVSIGMGFIYRGALTFLVAHLQENIGFTIFGWTPEAIAGAMATIVLLAAVPGQIMGGVLSDRIPVERAALPIMAVNPLMLALMASTSGLALILVSIGFVVTNFSQQPILNGLIADYAPDRAAGRAFGVSFFMTFGLGSFAGTIAGAVAENSGTGPMFTMLAVVAVGLLAAMLVVAADAERRRREIIAARTESAAAGS
jgi:MFS family permease